MEIARLDHDYDHGLAVMELANCLIEAATFILNPDRQRALRFSRFAVDIPNTTSSGIAPMTPKLDRYNAYRKERRQCTALVSKNSLKEP
jgi:hypothetical protein